MLRSRLQKTASTLLLVMLVMLATLAMATQTVSPALADEPKGGTDGRQSSTVSADYRSQDLGDLYDAGKLTVEGKGVTTWSDEPTRVPLFSGKRSAMLAARIVISKQFNFDQKPVGRFSVTGYAAAGKKVVLGFYLDDQADPFCVSQLECQPDADTWVDAQAVSTNVIAQNITGTHTLSIKVEECSSSPSFSLQSVEFAMSSVPVVNINIDESRGTIDAMNESAKHTYRCYGSLSITAPEGCTSAMTGKALEGTDELELSYIRGRGNSTWTANKKPYRFKLEDGADLLGMGKSKNWALMACAFDESMVRNTFTSLLGQKLNMPFTPNMEPVEVIMNGRYLGCYTLSELTATGTNRVEITVNDDPSSTGADTGYLLSLGNWTLDAGKRNFTTKKAHGVFQIESPSVGETGNDAQFDYIKNYVQAVEDAIYAHDAGTYTSLMDMESATKYYLIQEISGNGDSYTSGSCYLYKDVDGKLCWGPIWDFDLAWDAEGPKGYWAYNNRFWNAELFKDDVFVDAVKAMWPQFKAAMSQICAEGGDLDRVSACYAVAGGYDWAKWHVGEPDENGQGGEPEWAKGMDPFVAYPKSIERLRTAAMGTVSWAEHNFDTLQFKRTSIDLRVDGKVVGTVEGYVDCFFPTIKDPVAKKGYVFAGWQYTQTTTLEGVLADKGMTEAEYRAYLIDVMDYEEELADERIEDLRKGMVEDGDVAEGTYVAKGMVLDAKFVRADSVPPVKIKTFGSTYYGWLEPGEERTVTIHYETTPMGMDECNPVRFISSNEEVVASSIGSKYLMIKGEGDATVTIKPLVGTPKTVKVHIYSKEEYESVGPAVSDSLSFASKEITITKGGYAQLQVKGYTEGAVIEELPEITALDGRIVKVGSCGVLYGAKTGVTTVYFQDESGSLGICKVTVVEPTREATVGGLRYKALTSSTATCLGPAKKSIKSASVRSTVKIAGKKYKVTSVSKDAFRGCKKLAKVTLGKNVKEIGANAFRGCSKLKTAALGSGVQIVGAGAFRSCKKLTKVTFGSKNKPKVYSSAFKGSKKARFYVPKSQLSYYRLVLGKKKVRAK